MPELIEIRWHGRAGQGVVSAGKLLADAALGMGQYVQAFPDYGAEREGAPIRAFTRISPKPIYVHSQVANPDIVLVLDPTLLATVKVTEGLKPEGILVVNTPLSPQQIRAMLSFTGGKVYTVDASGIAIEELGQAITNTPMLGVLAATLDLFSVDQLAEEVRKNFGKKMRPEVVESNVRALKRAAVELKKG
jgi:pyruvate ferredoxin oxidoreductase gamma subunit